MFKVGVPPNKFQSATGALGVILTQTVNSKGLEQLNANLAKLSVLLKFLTAGSPHISEYHLVGTDAKKVTNRQVAQLRKILVTELAYQLFYQMLVLMGDDVIFYGKKYGVGKPKPDRVKHSKEYMEKVLVPKVLNAFKSLPDDVVARRMFKKAMMSDKAFARKVYNINISRMF